MSTDFQFLQNVRLSLGLPGQTVRTKKTRPQLFPNPQNQEAVEKIENRTQPDYGQLLEVLRENAKEINLQTHTVDTIQEAAATIVELIRSRDPEFSHNKHIIQHHHPDIAALKLWKRFNKEAITLHTSYDEDHDVREKTISSFIGITAPSYAVADSATVIQITTPGCPRSTSLLPSIHIALVRQDKIVANLAEAYSLLGEKTVPENFLFISGPSKTADIEAHMVHGAHGPREMHLVILTAQETESPQTFEKTKAAAPETEEEEH